MSTDRYRSWDLGEVWCTVCAAIVAAGAIDLHDAFHDRLDRLADSIQTDPCECWACTRAAARTGSPTVIWHDEVITVDTAKWDAATAKIAETLAKRRPIPLWDNGPAQPDLQAMDSKRCAVCQQVVAEFMGELQHVYPNVMGSRDGHAATLTSLSGPAAVRTSAPEPPTSVAPAGEDHGAPTEHVDTCRTCRDEIEADQSKPADPLPTHTCAIGNFADCEGCKWDATAPEPPVGSGWFADKYPGVLWLAEAPDSVGERLWSGRLDDRWEWKSWTDLQPGAPAVRGEA